MNESQHHRGPDETGMHFAPGHRTRSQAAVHHRPRHRPAAAFQRGWLGRRGVQRRDLQLPRADPGADRARPRLPHPQRHRGHRARLGSLGRGLRRALSRHVRLRRCGTRSAQTLFLARDRLGVKPLYYAQLPDGMLLFGSELKSLLAHGGLPREIDPRAVEDYFALGYVPEPRTVYASALKLPPAAHPVPAARAAGAPRRAATGTCASPAAIRSRPNPNAVLGHVFAPAPVSVVQGRGLPREQSAVIDAS